MVPFSVGEGLAAQTARCGDEGRVMSSVGSRCATAVLGARLQRRPTSSEERKIRRDLSISDEVSATRIQFLQRLTFSDGVYLARLGPIRGTTFFSRTSELVFRMPSRADGVGGARREPSAPVRSKPTTRDRPPSRHHRGAVSREAVQALPGPIPQKAQHGLDPARCRAPS
jgi:hypothetical protein